MTGNPHGGFIVAAYSAAAGTLAAMIGWVVMDFRRLSAQLDLATRALERHNWPSAIEIQVEAAALPSRYGTRHH